MAEQLRTLSSKRGQIKAKATRFKTYLESVEISKDISQLKSRLAKFEETYRDFESVQDEIELIESDTDQSIERESFENLYFEMIAKAESYFALDKPVSNTNASSSIESCNSNVNVKLPTIKLPSFGGKYEEWTSFQEIFHSLIHDNTSLTDTQRFHYLKTSLHGPAFSVIESLEVVSANYATAWSLLKERFENKRIIINKHIASLHNINKLEKESGHALRLLLDTVNKHLRALENLGQPVHSWDSLLIFTLSKKLDNNTLRLWESHIVSSKIPEFSEFTKFLQARCQTLESIDLSSASSKQQYTSNIYNPNHSSKLHPPRRHPTTLVTNNSLPCPSCNGNHKIFQCTEFKNLKPSERLSNAKRFGLCINCFSKSHVVKDCQAGNCKICNRKHNTLLHFDTNHDKLNSSKSMVEQSDGPSTSSKITLASQSTINDLEILLSTAVVEIEDSCGNRHDCRVLLDSASQSNFITEGMANKLKLYKHKTYSLVSGIGERQANITHSVVCTIHSKHTAYKASLNCLVMTKITNNLPHVKINTSRWNIPESLSLADFEFNTPSPIDMLIGAELFFNLLSIGQMRPHKNAPIFQKTCLGWVASGKVSVAPIQNVHTHCHLTINDKAGFDLQKFWEIEECGVKETPAKVEMACETLYKTTTTRDSAGRYTVRMPTKDNINQLGDSYGTATARLKQLENKLSKNPQLNKSYTSFMQEYEQLGHMEQVHDEQSTQVKYYIPHLPVIRDDSTTTKLRVVFDASAKTSSGISLNDTLMVGPTIQPDLFSILCRFRTHNFVLTADIEKMYRQIQVTDSQTDLQRILWRERPTEPVKIFRLKTVTYGTSSAPFLAIRTLHQLAMDEKGSFPKAAPIVMNDFYVDDLMTGAESEEELSLIQKQLTDLMESAGFHLRKWSTNSHSVLHQIPTEDRNPQATIAADSCTKVLGMLWNSQLDVFQYSVTSPDLHSKISKRSVLSEIARLFDPLGLLGPVILKAKLFMQQLWQLKVTWDESLPIELHSAWQVYRHQIGSLKELHIYRHIGLRQAHNIEVHGFCDASEKAYGACVYIRATNSDVTTVRLLCSKSRVAPLSTTTIPRLELCGAVLLSKLVHKLISLNFHIDSCTLWTDSSIVLAWIRAPHTAWKQFVSNRVKEIQSLTNNCTWKHVRTSHNPADIISRGLNPIQILDCSLWWNGPSWLAEEPENWPTSEPNNYSEIPEQHKKSQALATTVFKPIIKISNFSSLSRLQRTTAYCLRFIHNIRAPAQKQIGFLQLQELQEALKLIIKWDQQQSMNDDIIRLEGGREVLQNSPLSDLHPFLDSDRIVRVGGRLKNSSLSENQKHPVALSAKSPLSELIARQKHIQHLHAPPQLLLSIIRKQFWPLRGRDLVRKIVHSCIKCFKAKPRSIQPIMGNLPQHRTICTRPFTNTGTDLCGPFHIRSSKLRNSKTTKGYIVLFVCFSTKAIHLELVSDLTTETYLAAFKRFISRRGLCTNIYSDNGTNLVGADRELKQLRTLFLSEEHKKRVVYESSIHQINWHFIPPNSPHFGGLWEAGIRSVKYHLKRVVGNSTQTFEELYTTVSMIEACLNSRPLTPLSNDPNDLEPLTPGHFLIGDAITAIPEPNLTAIPQNRLLNWQRSQQITQHFWSRWSKEYLSTLQQRPKWRSNAANLKIDQLVIIKDDNLPPLKWITARVIDVHPGADNKVRVATVKTATGVFRRAANKLCILPIDPPASSEPVSCDVKNGK